MYVAIGFAILFFAGTSWKQLTALAALFVAASCSCWWSRPRSGYHVLKPYQMQRLTSFLHPSHDPQNQTLQHHQSLIAIGSGGKTGLGAAGATPGQRSTSCRRREDDFIFAVVGETYGFVGAALVLSLYALLIWRDAAHPDDVQEPVRHADRGRRPRDADVPGLRQRRA